MRPLLVGIDPGASVGVAAVDPSGQLVAARTYAWPRRRERLFAWLREAREKGAIAAAVELSDEGIWAGLPRRRALSRFAIAKIARDVGRCDERGREIMRVCEQLGYLVEERRPVKRGTKLARHVWNGLFPDWAGRRISGHARDAAVLARVCAGRIQGHG